MFVGVTPRALFGSFLWRNPCVCPSVVVRFPCHQRYVWFVVVAHKLNLKESYISSRWDKCFIGVTPRALFDMFLWRNPCVCPSVVVRGPCHQRYVWFVVVRSPCVVVSSFFHPSQPSWPHMHALETPLFLVCQKSLERYSKSVFPNRYEGRVNGHR